MTHLFPKFIIEIDDDEGICLIFSKCVCHKDLVINKDKVRGGGWFRIENNTMTLGGKSFDFGSAKIEDIKEAIENDNVYPNPYLSYSVAKKYKFVYDNCGSLIKLN